MKKFLSVFLAGLMLVLCLVPAVNTNKASASTALHWNSYTYPIIHISGDGDTLYDADGNALLKFRDIAKAFSSDGSDEEGGGTTEAVKNILSALVKGIQTDDYTEYYDIFYDEVSDLFEGLQLDKDGNPKEGTGISQARKDSMTNSLKHDYMRECGYYPDNGYHFWYDWRLDPFELADQLHEYIEAVKKVTHQDKIILMTKCIGTQVALAYIVKYGMDDIYGVGFGGGTMNGAETLSEAICGKFALDGNATVRFINDLEYYGFIDGFDDFVMDTVDMLSKCGVIDVTKEVLKKTVYEKLAEGVTSALARATFFGLPAYWACVTNEDYDDAMNYVFGEEGSEKRTEYAGLIEKIEYYHNNVVARMDDILKEIDDSGCNICVIAKYGSQMVPICESMNKLGDQIISVERASLGATTSNIMETLSDEYIEKQAEAGLYRYISPDKQIDASTCYWPDYTWFEKGASHSNWTDTETMLMCTVLSAKEKLTVKDLDITQFFVATPVLDENGNLQYNAGNGFMVNECTAMTEENCHTETWADEINPDENILTKLYSGFSAFTKWLPQIINRIIALVNELTAAINKISGKTEAVTEAIQ